jgi:hypothetical protein
VIAGLMFDSTTPELIPPWARLKALYVNGKFAHHPDYGRGRIFIDVIGNAPFGAEVLDVEREDATPATVHPWLQARSRWEQGTIYCNESTLPAVQEAAQGLPFYLWLATLDGALPAHSGPGQLVAVQAYGAQVTGANVDLSVVLDEHWWRKHALPPIR